MGLIEGDAADMSDGVAVAPEMLIGPLPTFTAADANATKRFGYIGGKRYLRLSVAPAGAGSALLSAVAVKGHPARAPVPF